ncbi:MAG: hypothetical protein GY849_04690 [Deltaproteobacteria bacterium]|nr:hypothetical protein [Deltaproteobacteria bacterium]
MYRRYVMRLLSLIFCFTLIAALGCGKAKPPARDIKPQGSGEVKRVIVLPFIDNSGLGKGTAAQATARFIELLGKSRYVTIQDPPKGMVLPDEASSPKYGIVTPPQLIKKAEALGLDALITGVIDPVAGITKKRGIWPFRSNRRIYDVSAIINVVHVPSKTVLLTRFETEKVSLPLEKQVDEKALAGRALDGGLPDVLKSLAKAASKSLGKDLSQRLRHGK